MLNLRDLVTWPGYSSLVDPWPWSRDLDTPHLWIHGLGHVAWILLTCGSLALVTCPRHVAWILLAAVLTSGPP